MKKTGLLALIFGLGLLQAGCDNGGGNAFGDGGLASGDAQPASRTNFTLLFSEWALTAFNADDGSFTETSTDINLHIADRNGIPVSGKTIELRAEWGVLDASSCTTDTSGNCTITWTTSDSQLAPKDTYCVRIVAYTTGEEAYFETNINDNTLDDADAASAQGNAAPFSNGFIDMEEPYFDRDRSNTWSAGDLNIDLNGNKTHDTGDGKFNGENCTATGGQCTTTTSTTIWVDDYIDLKDETTGSGTVNPAPATNTCVSTFYP